MKQQIRQGRGIALWLSANAVGAATYLWLSSKTWTEPELRGLPGVSRPGDAVVWGLSALPLLLVCMAANFAWSWRRWRGQQNTAELLIFVPWMLAFGVDRFFS